MSAFPFGGHPTFGQYLTWAISQGCKVQVGVDTERSIGVTKIVSADGKKWVFQAGTQPGEYLTPTDVGRLDRRLGLLSPWFGAPLDS
jgi:hypothetical protein